MCQTFVPINSLDFQMIQDFIFRQSTNWLRKLSIIWAQSLKIWALDQQLELLNMKEIWKPNGNDQEKKEEQEFWATCRQAYVVLKLEANVWRL